MHRDQYKDHTGQRHPLNYFKNSEYKFQCPPDPTRYLINNQLSTYLNLNVFRIFAAHTLNFHNIMLSIGLLLFYL